MDWVSPGHLNFKVSRNSLQNFHRTGERETLEGLVCIRTQEKGVVTLQEAEPDLPVYAWESLAEVWVNSDLLCGQGL